MKKRLFYGAIVLILLLTAGFWTWRKVIKPKFGHAMNEKYYFSKLKDFKKMDRTENQIIFLGDSITDFVNFDEFLPEKHIINRGIAGDTTVGVLNRLDEVISLKPRKIFLLIGTNDIALGRSTEVISKNIVKIITRLQKEIPTAKIYLQNLFPTNSSKFHVTGWANDKINELNAELEKIAREKNYTLIDLHSLLLKNGELDENFTVDGLHLNSAANAKWFEFIAPQLDE